MMKINKKGISPIGLLGEILIVLAVIVILLAVVIVPKIFSTSDVVGGQIGGIQGDADKDGTRNFADKCPCTFGDDPLYDGCPSTFTDIEKQEDVKKYNSEQVCGIRIGETVPGIISDTPEEKEAAKKAAEQKSEPAAFKRYQSIEIFGDGVDEEDLPHDGIIKQACTGWIGSASCHSEDDDCDGKFSLEPLKDGCWIMASEDDNEGNDCGQAKVADGKTIPLQGYRPLNIDLTNDYQSVPNEDDPKNLFRWAWKSKPEYGALLCDQGFWRGCTEAQEGKDYILRSNQAYKCTSGEWIKQ